MLRRFSFVVLLVIALAGCSAGRDHTPNVTLKVGLGYLPSVQFAQFYRALRQGYYRDAGLDVTFQNEIAPNLVTLVGQGALDAGIADGTDVIPAVGQGIPVRYAATIYARFPNAVVAPAASNIKAAADLRGRSVGIPGRYGSSWVMLQALLASANLTTNDIDVREYPDYGQGTALQQGQVDAATAFRNNEPVQLRLAGFATTQLTIDEITPLPGPGLIVGLATLASKRDSLHAFVAATLRAMTEIIANPQVGLDDSIAQVPDLASARATQLQILQATIETWQSPYTVQNGLGAIDPGAWTTSLDFMRNLPDSNIPQTLTVDQLVTEDLLP